MYLRLKIEELLDADNHTRRWRALWDGQRSDWHWGKSGNVVFRAERSGAFPLFIEFAGEEETSGPFELPFVPAGDDLLVEIAIGS